MHCSLKINELLQLNQKSFVGSTAFVDITQNNNSLQLNYSTSSCWLNRIRWDNSESWANDLPRLFK